MNARQKCKKLKKELEYFNKIPITTIYRVTDIPTEHLKANIVFPLYNLTDGGTFADDAARSQLTKTLSETIRRKIVVNKEEIREGGFSAIRYSTDIFIGFGER